MTKGEVYVWHVWFIKRDDMRDKFIRDIKKLLEKYYIFLTETNPDRIEPLTAKWQCRDCKKPVLALIDPNKGEIIATFEIN